MQLYNEEYIYQVFLNYEDTNSWYSSNSIHGFDEVWEWCDNVIGVDMWMHDYREIIDADVFQFKQEAHRSWFLLRWM